MKTDYIDTSERDAELWSAISWLQTAPEQIAKKVDAPADLKHRGLVEIMVVSGKRGVQIDVHLTILMHRSLACEDAPTFVEAVRKVRASLREKELE